MPVFRPSGSAANRLALGRLSPTFTGSDSAAGSVTTALGIQGAEAASFARPIQPVVMVIAAMLCHTQPGPFWFHSFR
ncbi:MAG: hypothetical protein PW792_12890 [Acidobacteriaceae bacterium]|nr:hypothetical protein [Acidobacteriaceae bacterium]